MRRALCSRVIQGAIPSFPASTGFEVIGFFQSVRHPRDGVVLCSRGNNSETDGDYVVWNANMIEGGCHCGTYTLDFDKAWKEFQRRISVLN